MVHIVFELGFLQLLERFFHNSQLRLKLSVGCLQIPQMLIALTLGMPWGARMLHVSLLGFTKTLYGSVLVFILVWMSLFMCSTYF